MTLAIDVDGVLRDFCGQLVRQYQKDYPHHKVKPITAWDLSLFFPIGKDIYDYFLKRRAVEIFVGAPQFHGAAEFVGKLKVRGHHVAILTSQPRGNEHLTLTWLNINRIAFDSLVFSSQKHLFNFDVILDDSVHNLDSAREAGKRAVCYNQPYNQEWQGERVKTYDEFLAVV